MSWVFDKMDLADIYRCFYLITDYKSISNTRGTFSRVDQMSHKTSPLKCIWLQQYLVSFRAWTAWNYNSISGRILENYASIKPHACDQTVNGWKEKPKEIRKQVELQEGSYLNKCLHWYCTILLPDKSVHLGGSSWRHPAGKLLMRQEVRAQKLPEVPKTD